MTPPLWPVGPERLTAELCFHPISGGFSVGPVTVDVLEGAHPGGVTLFRLSGGGKRVVFLTDCTLTEELLPAVEDFARDCDLLLCDGQYSDAEWPQRSTFGHNTWSMAARLGRRCGAKTARIIHHDPRRTDRELVDAQKAITVICPNCAFARAGEEIQL